jgi:hypothetical protein
MVNPNILRDTKVRVEEFLLSEAAGMRSRDTVTLAANVAPIQAGTLLGKVTATGFMIPYNNAAADGSQQAVGVLRNFVPISTTPTKETAFTRDCEVDSFFLTGADAPGIADLALLGVIVR